MLVITAPDGWRRAGTAVEAPGAVDPREVARALRGEAAATDLSVRAPDPTPVHEHVGCIRPDMGLRTRTALAKAGRTLGIETPVDDALAEVRGALAERRVADPGSREARRTAAEATTETARLREAVATARGRLEARRATDSDPEPAATDLADAIRRLSEAETRRVSARQRLEAERAATRERRTRREDRFRLADRVANLEREARSHLIAELEPTYAETLRAVPGCEETRPFEAPPVSAALAIARLADLRAPLVVAAGRFETPADARAFLGTPVVQV